MNHKLIVQVKQVDGRSVIVVVHAFVRAAHASIAVGQMAESFLELAYLDRQFVFFSWIITSHVDFLVVLIQVEKDR